LKIKEIEHQNNSILNAKDLEIEDLKKLVENQRKNVDTKFKSNDELER
jgi:hypothetical protein